MSAHCSLRSQVEAFEGYHIYELCGKMFLDNEDGFNRRMDDMYYEDLYNRQFEELDYDNLRKLYRESY